MQEAVKKGCQYVSNHDDGWHDQVIEVLIANPPQYQAGCETAYAPGNQVACCYKMPEPGNEKVCSYKMPEPEYQDDRKDSCQSNEQIAHPILGEQDLKVIQGKRFGGSRREIGTRRMTRD